MSRAGVGDDHRDGSGVGGDDLAVRQDVGGVGSRAQAVHGVAGQPVVALRAGAAAVFLRGGELTIGVVLVDHSRGGCQIDHRQPTLASLVQQPVVPAEGADGERWHVRECPPGIDEDVEAERGEELTLGPRRAPDALRPAIVERQGVRHLQVPSPGDEQRWAQRGDRLLGGGPELGQQHDVGVDVADPVGGGRLIDGMEHGVQARSALLVALDAGQLPGAGFGGRLGQALLVAHQEDLRDLGQAAPASQRVGLDGADVALERLGNGGDGDGPGRSSEHHRTRPSRGATTAQDAVQSAADHLGRQMALSEGGGPTFRPEPAHPGWTAAPRRPRRTRRGRPPRPTPVRRGGAVPRQQPALRRPPCRSAAPRSS